MKGLFKRSYKVRVYAGQEVSDGFASATYIEKTALLDVQPVTNDAQGLPEGDRREARVKTFGSFPFQPADQYTGRPGDRLFYDGLWWECASAEKWDWGPLAHYNADFVLTPEVEDDAE
jgi:hypothetical protein